MNSNLILQAIDEEIARLTRARDLLLTPDNSKPAPAAKKRTLSPEGRKKIVAAMKRRWAAAKKAA